jgi:pyruvate-formate lyase-activating enzyme
MAGSFLTLPETSEHKELILSLLESLQHVDWRNLDLKTRGSVRVARALATDESSANVVKTVQMEGRKKATKIKVRNVVIS